MNDNPENKNTINVESLYTTLALIIGRKHNVKISVKVIPVEAVTTPR